MFFWSLELECQRSVESFKNWSECYLPSWNLTTKNLSGIHEFIYVHMFEWRCVGEMYAWRNMCMQDLPGTYVCVYTYACMLVMYIRLYTHVWMYVCKFVFWYLFRYRYLYDSGIDVWYVFHLVWMYGLYLCIASYCLEFSHSTLSTASRLSGEPNVLYTSFTSERSFQPYQHL